MKFVDLIVKLKSEFSLTPWELVKNAIDAADCGYGGCVHLSWYGEKSFDVGASLKIEATTDGINSEHTGNATIKWHTSSGHIVIIVLSLRDTDRGWWKVESVTIGDDDSECFYSLIKGLIPKNLIKIEKYNVLRSDL